MSAELMKSKCVRRLSSVRRPPSVRVVIISEPNARISFKFWLLLPLTHTLGCFFNFWILFKIFLRIFFVFLCMAPYGSQNFKTLLPLQIAAESFQTFSECSSQWSTTQWDQMWVKWDPMGVKISNTTPPTNHSQNFSNFSWIVFQVVLKNYIWDFWNFENWNDLKILMIFFFRFPWDMGPYGSQDSKTLLLLQVAAESLQTFFWIFFPMVFRKRLGFLKFWKLKY